MTSRDKKFDSEVLHEVAYLRSKSKYLRDTSHSLRLTSLYHARYRFRVRLLASRKEEERKGFGTARTIWDAILRRGVAFAIKGHAQHCLHSVNTLCIIFILYCGTSEVMTLSLPIHFYIQSEAKCCKGDRGWSKDLVSVDR